MTAITTNETYLVFGILLLLLSLGVSIRITVNMVLYRTTNFLFVWIAGIALILGIAHIQTWDYPIEFLIQVWGPIYRILALIVGFGCLVGIGAIGVLAYHERKKGN